MKKFIPGLIFIVVFIIAAIIYYQYSTRKTQKIVENLKKEYPSISIEEGVNAVITNVSHGDPDIFRNNPHHAFVTLGGSIKKRIVASFELNQELMLDEVLEEGDRLVKESGTDRFGIYKIQSNDTLVYEFKLQDDLGYPLKKQD